MFRVTKQMRAFLAEVQDEVCDATAAAFREVLAEEELPAELKEVFDRVVKPETLQGEHPLRITFRDDEPTLKPEMRENVRATDRKFQHGGKVVLVVDGVLARSLDDLTLDLSHTDKGPAPRFRYHSEWA